MVSERKPHEICNTDSCVIFTSRLGGLVVQDHKNYTSLTLAASREEALRIAQFMRDWAQDGGADDDV